MTIASGRWPRKYQQSEQDGGEMAICPYCRGGYSSVDELGLKMHKFSDRWIPCCNGTEKPHEDEFSPPMRADSLRILSASVLVLIRTLVSRMPTQFR